MRSDLTKVLTERERSGSRSRNYHQIRRKNGRIDIDEDGTNLKKQGMKKAYGYDTKNFTDVLSPLKGIIRKAVGRKWDDLYSELSQNIDRRSVQGNHVFEHLYDFIIVNDSKGRRYGGDGIVVQDGKLFVRRNALYYSRNPNRGLTPIEDYLDDRLQFYVDPRDGIIKKKKPVDPRIAKQREAEAAAEKAKTYRQLTKDLVVAKMPIRDKNALVDKIIGYGDVWFAFDLLPVPKTVKTMVRKPVTHLGLFVGYEMVEQEVQATVSDQYNGKTLTYGTPHTAYWSNCAKFYHTNKRTASHKLLKQYGVV